MIALDAEPVEKHDSLEGIPGPAATIEPIGHDAPLGELISADREDRLHHGWLLQGPRGIGKATAAFAFARHLLSSERSAVCVSPALGLRAEVATARQIATDGHPNLVHLTRARVERGTGFRTQITVDEIRRLNRFFQATSSGDRWRIAIIDPADDMNRNAANALLKILEEPPRRSLFLIVSHSAGRLLPTIRSRCRTLRFSPLRTAEVEEAARHLMPSADGDEIAGAAARSDGSVRRALELVISGGTQTIDRLDAVLSAARPDWQSVQGLCDAVTQRGADSAYTLTLEAMLAAISQQAEEQARQGNIKAASRYAEFWQREAARLQEAEAYNLDRKQTMLTLFSGFFGLRGSQG